MAHDHPTVSRRLTLHAAAFLLGVSAVFISLGALGGALGRWLDAFGEPLRVAVGALLVLFGLSLLGLLPLPLLQRELRLQLTHKPGYAGSLLVGLAFGAGWTPCIGPILASIITIASASGSAAQGALLLAIYALGFAIPFLLIARALPRARAISRYGAAFKRLSGALVMLVGLLLISGALAQLSPYLASLGNLESRLGLQLAVLPGERVPLALYPLALAAGALSLASPCVLPILPAFLAYLCGIGPELLDR